MSDLAFYTSEELVQELVNRSTLVGLVVRSEQEAGKTAGHRNFRVDFTPNLSQEQAVIILDGLLEQLKTQR